MFDTCYTCVDICLKVNKAVYGMLNLYQDTISKFKCKNNKLDFRQDYLSHLFIKGGIGDGLSIIID